MRLNRSEIKDVVLAAVIFVAFYFTASSLAGQQAASLKREINTAIQTQCEANTVAPLLKKYNDLAAGLTLQQVTALTLNTKEGNAEKAAADARFAQRFSDDQIAIVKADCSVSFLK